MITKPHYFRHFLLQVGPIERRVFLRFFRDRARRVVNRIAAENEKRFYFGATHPIGQLENAFRIPIARKLPDHNSAPDIFERGIHCVSE